MKKTTRKTKRYTKTTSPARSYNDHVVTRILHKKPFSVLLLIVVALVVIVTYGIVSNREDSDASVTGSINWKTSFSSCSPTAGSSGVEGGNNGGSTHYKNDVAAVTNPVRQGQCSASISVHPGDVYGGSTGERTLIQYIPAFGSNRAMENTGDEYWYGGSVYIPAGYDQSSGSWNFLFEWHGPSGTQAPLRMSAQGNRLAWQLVESVPQGSPQAAGLNCSAGYCTKSLPSVTVPLTKADYSDRWVDLMWHVKWTGDRTTGYFEGWWKRPSIEGHTWQYLGKTNAALQPWPSNYFLLGIYRSALQNITHTAYYGDFYRGSTRDIIENEFGSLSSQSPTPAPQEEPVQTPSENPATQPTPAPTVNISPKDKDRQIVIDVTGDGIKEVVKDLNQDGKIDPATEIVKSSRELSAINPSSPAAQSGTDTSNVTIDLGALGNIMISKLTVYVILAAGAAIVITLATYLLVTKSSFFIKIRNK